jgi:RNA polymerase sigma factor (sigma-70 family)
MGNEGVTVGQFVADFSALVRKIAWKLIQSYWGWFGDPREEYEDLCAAGMLELVAIHERVDFQNQGYKSFVATRVRGCLMNYIYRSIPDVGDSDLANEDDPSPERPSGRRHFVRPDSVEAMTEAGAEPAYTLEIEDLLFLQEILVLMDAFMGSLAPKEQFMLVSWLRDGRTQEDIGRIVGYNRDTVRKKINEALEKLRKMLVRKCSIDMDKEGLIACLRETDQGVMIEEGGPALGIVRKEKQP